MTRFWSSLTPILAAAMVALAMLATPAAAQSLDELRASGQVGEKFNGLAVARDSGVSDFVEKVNEKRLAIYVEQANKQGVPTTQVGMVYAQEILEQVPAGTWFLTKDGEWLQK